MSSEANEAVARRVIEEVWNQGILETLDELYVPEDRSVSVAQFKEIVQAFRLGFPDLHVTINDLIVAGDRVVSRWTARGTHRGAFEALSASDITEHALAGERNPRLLIQLAPTGRAVIFEGVFAHRVRDGRIVSQWSVIDHLPMLQQLGALPVLHLPSE